MPQRIDADATDQIDEGVAVDIGQMAADAMIHRDASPQGETLQPGREMLLFARHQRL